MTGQFIPKWTGLISCFFPSMRWRSQPFWEGFKLKPFTYYAFGAGGWRGVKQKRVCQLEHALSSLCCALGLGIQAGFYICEALKLKFLKVPLNSYVCPKSKRLWSWLTASSEAWRWLHLLPPRPLHATGGCRANRCSPFRGQPVNPWYPWMTWDWCSWTALICGSLKPS